MINIPKEKLSSIDELIKYGEWDDISTLNIFELYVYSELFLRTVATQCFYDNKKLVSNHLTLLNDFLSLDESHLQIIKEKLWEHCEFLFYMADYGAEFEGQTNYEFFNIFTLEDAYENANLESLSIDIEENVCQLIFYPAWEDEHGFIVDLAQGKLIFEPYNEEIYKEFSAYRKTVERKSNNNKVIPNEADDNIDSDDENKQQIPYTDTTLEIKTVVKQLKFDSLVDSFSDRFTEDDIAKALLYENTLPQIKDVLPEDYKWYMQNYGSAYFDTCYLITQYDDATYIAARAVGILEPVAVYQAYAYHTRIGSYAYRMDELEEVDNKLVLDKKFMPITDSSNDIGGGMIVMDIEDQIGSIWRIPPKIEFDNHNIQHLAAYFVADSFTAFLKGLATYGQDCIKLKEQGFSEGKETTNYHLWRKSS